MATAPADWWRAMRCAPLHGGDAVADVVDGAGAGAAALLQASAHACGFACARMTIQGMRLLEWVQLFHFLPEHQQEHPDLVAAAVVIVAAVETVAAGVAFLAELECADAGAALAIEVVPAAHAVVVKVKPQQQSLASLPYSGEAQKTARRCAGRLAKHLFERGLGQLLAATENPHPMRKSSPFACCEERLRLEQRRRGSSRGCRREASFAGSSRIPRISDSGCWFDSPWGLETVTCGPASVHLVWQ